MDRCKKIVSFFLCFLLLFPLIPTLPVFAIMDDLAMEDGIITMSFTDKKATTGITYHTIGFIIHRNVKSGLDANYSDAPVGNLIGERFQEIDSEDAGGGKVTTYFKMSEEDVTLAMTTAGMESWADGETIYLDSVFEVLHNGVSTEDRYYSYDEIANAESWGNQTKQDLKAYYNIPLVYKSPNFPVYKQVIINGKPETRELVSEIKAGASQNVIFKKSITKGGVTADIEKSYFLPIMEPNKKNFEVDKTNPAVISRNVIQPVGGVTVVAEYKSGGQVTVRYLDIATNKDIANPKIYEAEAGSNVQETAMEINGYTYDYSVYSMDNGQNWKNRTTAKTRNDKAGTQTLINFYYNSQGTVPPPDIKPPDGGGNTPDPTPTPGGDTTLKAKLTLSCDPQAIERGKKETVEFVLDASGCMASAGVDYYNFWFNDTGKFDWSKPDYIKQKSPVFTIKKNQVEPGSTWYARVQVIDKKGNPDTAEAEVTIEEIVPEPKAEAHAKIKVNVIQDDTKIEEWDDTLGWMGYYKLTMRVPADWDRNKNMNFRFALDGTESTSTNGVGSYYFNRVGEAESPDMEGPAAVKTLDQIIMLSPQEYIDEYLSQGREWSDEGYLNFRLKVTDSLDSSATDTALAEIVLKYVFERDAPSVTVDINKKEFAKGETAEFYPKYVENENTYPITGKRWEILDKNGNLVDSGDGDLPGSYPIYIAEGEYIGKQYISYTDDNLEDHEDSAQVDFHVYGIKPPDVTIACDKDTYLIPATGIFTTTFFEDPNFTYNITGKDYKLINENGTVITEGSGKFPDTYAFTLDLDSGFYIAQQTIHWKQNGEEKQKTAECRFKLISPKPAAEFQVNMKMSEAAQDWNRIDVEGETGKVFKQIRIDLTPTIALNQKLENPYPVLFNSPNTQIQILPLNEDASLNRERIQKVYTYNAADFVRSKGIGTVSGKQFIDVRFDEPGVYTIKCRVANEAYIGNWIERNIIIRPELPPVVDMVLNNVVPDAEPNYNIVYRNTKDLSVEYGLTTTATPQDEDSIDPTSAKLEFRFDYNSDSDASNDGIHSEMFVTKAKQQLQPYVSITNNEQMNDFKIRLLSDSFPILGKMRLEYSVGEKPLIPNYIGGALPPVPEQRGTSELLPLNKKIVFADNKVGVIDLDLGKESKIEINIILGVDTPSFDVHALKEYYGDNAVIYVIDKDGNRQLIGD